MILWQSLATGFDPLTLSLLPSTTTKPAESHIRDRICTDPREIRPCRWLLSISTSGLTWRTTAPSSLSDPQSVRLVKSFLIKISTDVHSGHLSWQ